MPCKIHSPPLISAHSDLQGLDRRFVCGFIGESKSRIAASQFKGYVLGGVFCTEVRAMETSWPNMSKQVRY